MEDFLWSGAFRPGPFRSGLFERRRKRLTGTWKVVFTGPIWEHSKTFAQMVFNLTAVGAPSMDMSVKRRQKRHVETSCSLPCSDHPGTEPRRCGADRVVPYVRLGFRTAALLRKAG